MSRESRISGNVSGCVEILVESGKKWSEFSNFALTPVLARNAGEGESFGVTYTGCQCSRTCPVPE